MAGIGENIKRLREEHGWSQSELAEKIGKTRAAIWQYEHGDTVPRMGVVEDLAQVFGVKKSAIIETRLEYMGAEYLSADERELIELYRSLSTRGQNAVLVGLREYAGK